MNKVSLMSFVLFYSSIYALESCPVHPWTKTFMSIHPLLCFVHVPPSQEQPCPSIGQPLKTFMNSWVQSVLVLPQLKTPEPILVWVWRKRLYPSQPFSEFLQSKTTPATSPSPRRFIHQLFKVSSSQSGHAPILLPLTPVPANPCTLSFHISSSFSCLSLVFAPPFSGFNSQTQPNFWPLGAAVSTFLHCALCVTMPLGCGWGLDRDYPVPVPGKKRRTNRYPRDFERKKLWSTTKDWSSTMINHDQPQDVMIAYMA